MLQTVLEQIGRNGDLHLVSYLMRMSSRIKGKFYKVIVRPAMLCEAECWLLKNLHIQKMKVGK